MSAFPMVHNAHMEAMVRVSLNCMSSLYKLLRFQHALTFDPQTESNLQDLAFAFDAARKPTTRRTATRIGTTMDASMLSLGYTPLEAWTVLEVNGYLAWTI